MNPSIAEFLQKAEPYAKSVGLSPIHIAAREERLDVMEWIVNEESSNLSMEDSWTPLHEAARYRRLKSVEWLVSRGHVIHPKEATGRTPLRCALDRGHLEVSKLECMIIVEILSLLTSNDDHSEGVEDQMIGDKY
jgi:ankyrin repeat protein